LLLFVLHQGYILPLLVNSFLEITLVVRGDQTGICFAVIPGNAQLDLKVLAQISGNRKVETVALKEVQPLT
jgi:prolyl-tRNA editing enzyme YbaK/EbsC (Cys-tRNA(Pro) deacylase)